MEGYIVTLREKRDPPTMFLGLFEHWKIPVKKENGFYFVPPDLNQEQIERLKTSGLVEKFYYESN